jgi:hypothetical protein
VLGDACGNPNRRLGRNEPRTVLGDTCDNPSKRLGRGKP